MIATCISLCSCWYKVRELLVPDELANVLQLGSSLRCDQMTTGKTLMTSGILYTVATSNDMAVGIRQSNIWVAYIVVNSK